MLVGICEWSPTIIIVVKLPYRWPSQKEVAQARTVYHIWWQWWDRRSKKDSDTHGKVNETEDSSVDHGITTRSGRVYRSGLPEVRATRGAGYPRCGLPEVRATRGAGYPRCGLPEERATRGAGYPRSGLPEERATRGASYPNRTTVEYRRGYANGNADTISRLPKATVLSPEKGEGV